MHSLTTNLTANNVLYTQQVHDRTEFRCTSAQRDAWLAILKTTTAATTTA